MNAIPDPNFLPYNYPGIDKEAINASKKAAYIKAMEAFYIAVLASRRITIEG